MSVSISMLSDIDYLISFLVGSSQMSEVVQQSFVQLLLVTRSVRVVSLLFIIFILSQPSVLHLQKNSCVEENDLWVISAHERDTGGEETVTDQ